MISTIAMSAASSAPAGKLSGADQGMEAVAGPLAVVNAGSDGPGRPHSPHSATAWPWA